MQQVHNSILRLLGRVLHDQDDEITHEPLPKRWVDLIHFLDEQERKNYERSLGDQVAEAELAVAKQEKVLRELMRTEEPTEEARALLEELRENVARAVAKRN
jgi:lysyl-tRNA synthetase class I